MSIHETADADAAVGWWAAEAGVPAERFQPTTIKRHKPSGKRRNHGDDYHGCLTISVLRSRELYWRIAAVMAALTDSGA